MRPLLSQRQQAGAEPGAPLLGDGSAPLPLGADDSAAEPTIMPMVAAYDIQMPGEADGALDDLSSDPVARLKRLIEQRQGESVEVLRNWMENSEGRA
jgi:flagellar M-ring protein FliF